jgi:sterol desaturase/sphingolipid hydroxylase (fatty acid hydroxylase superfamily)
MMRMTCISTRSRGTTHHLHHKHIEAYHAGGAAVIDKLFGTWHDGSKQAQALMEARYANKVARMNERS